MVDALLLCCALIRGAPDDVHLRYLALQKHLQPRAVIAIAYEESAHNLDPRLRGHFCWWKGHHERDCEVGRYQIRPSTARSRCRGLNIWTYGGNTACFIKMFAEDTQRLGLERAIRAHNGSGDIAEDYLTRVLADMERLTQEGEK